MGFFTGLLVGLLLITAASASASAFSAASVAATAAAAAAAAAVSSVARSHDASCISVILASPALPFSPLLRTAPGDDDMNVPCQL